MFDNAGDAVGCLQERRHGAMVLPVLQQLHQMITAHSAVLPACEVAQHLNWRCTADSEKSARCAFISTYFANNCQNHYLPPPTYMLLIRMSLKPYASILFL